MHDILKLTSHQIPWGVYQHLAAALWY